MSTLGEPVTDAEGEAAVGAAVSDVLAAKANPVWDEIFSESMLSLKL